LPSKPTEHWYEKTAALMVREEISLFAATQTLDLGITNRECENIVRTKGFIEVLRNERNKFYKELANDPSRNRNSAVGQLVLAITKMMESEQYDKAVTAIMSLAKLEGWSSDSANVNIFNDMTAKDLAALRTKFAGQKKSLEVN